MPVADPPRTLPAITCDPCCNVEQKAGMTASYRAAVLKLLCLILAKLTEIEANTAS